MQLQFAMHKLMDAVTVIRLITMHKLIDAVSCKTDCYAQVNGYGHSYKTDCHAQVNGCSQL